MVRLVPILDAKKLAEKNRDKSESLNKKQKAAQKKAEKVQADLQKAYEYGFDGFATRFAQAFALIKNVDLTSLPVLDAVPELKLMDVKVRGVAVDAVAGLTALAGGSAAGAAAGGLTFAAVGAFATASTGVAIGGLGGAAATSATLAWLGGGSIAAGGGGVAAGTAVLASVVAAPVVLAAGVFLWWQGEKAYNQQREIAAKLTAAEADLEAQFKLAELANKHANARGVVVKRLADAGIARLPQLFATLERTTDYTEFDTAEREHLAELAAIATTVAAVIACPLLDEKSNVPQASADAVAAAEAAADRLAA